MDTRIDYRASIYNGLGRKTGTGSLSYTPTLDDAITWSETNEQFTFVLDLLKLGLVSDGDEYCTAQIEAVEDAYIALLGKDSGAHGIMREAGGGFVTPERYKLVCPECGRLWTDDHTC
jgi:hypothetical protein